MKKYNLSLVLLLVVIPVVAQTHVTSQSVTVSGLVEKEVVLGKAEILTKPSVSIPDVVITSHTGESRGTAKGLKGVLVRDLHGSVTIKAESPKVLSEFYLTFIASDGYTVVFSWNELFNSPTGDNCFLITEKEGKMFGEIPDTILVITPTDVRTGRRNIKGLSRIVVARVGKE